LLNIMRNHYLSTFGYEGLTIEAFVQRLQAAKVNLIVDVRELPLSRKKGFSKNAFREYLVASGIAYEHRPALGCPRPIRDQYRSDADWAVYTRGFLAYLRSQKEELRALADVASAIRACLVCYEADPAMCHRSYGRYNTLTINHCPGKR
jgi:uncharacterized protein (DUF488 family)